MKKINNEKRKGLTFPIKLFISSIVWLGTLMKISATERKLILKVLTKIANVYNTRGKHECIIYTKHLRSSLINFLFKDDGVQYYLPKVLLPLETRFRLSDNYPLIRLALSVTYSSRFIRLKEDPSFDSIEKRPGFTGNLQSIEKDVRKFLKKALGVNPIHFGKIPKNLHFKEFHMTSKTGPTGQHALWSCFYDIIHMPNYLKQSIKIVGGFRLYDLMDRFSSLYSKIPDFFKSYSPHGDMCLRKLSAIRDKEGKTREVAILDYWSQSALRPLHQYLFRVLSRIDQDCTHDQTKWLGKLVPRKGSSFHSIDLTTATDRFPIAIEKLILSTWFGREFANAWESIMIGLPFWFKPLDKYVYYLTGNPMGAYSSWASFALAHHFFVFLSCERAGVRWKSCPYMLLGDDIVIADDKVAKEYMKLLSEWDIPFNPDKSHTSSKGYEFAKQYILDNKNISPFPIGALYERHGSTFECLAIVTRELTYKDWNSDIWASLKSFLRIVFGKSRNEIRRQFPKLKLGISLMLYLQGKSDLGTSLQEYVAETTHKKVSWTAMSRTAYEQFIAADVVTNLFLEVRDKVTGNNPYPLGQLAVDMVMAITSLEEDGMDCFDKIEAVPFLQIYGRAEETYIKLLKPTIGARLIRDGSQMRAALEIVDIPLSDRDFYVRQRDVIVIKSLKASKKIVDLLKLHMVRINNYHRNPIGPFLLDQGKD